MEEEKVLVLDATVAVKWFTNEPLRDKALLIRDKYVKGLVDLIAPGLLFYEVANALRYNPRFGVEEVKNALKALEKLGISLYDFLRDNYVIHQLSWPIDSASQCMMLRTLRWQ